MIPSQSEPGPMNTDLKYVNAFQDRHGRWRYYFRRNGKRTPLPGDPRSDVFLAAYAAMLAAVNDRAEPSRKAVEGSLDALRQAWAKSAEFGNLADSTQREAKYCIEALCQMVPKSGIGKIGDGKIVNLTRAHILAWRDSMKNKPGAANKMVRTLKQLLSFAVDRQLIQSSPAAGIKMLKLGSFRDWSDDELLQFEARWPLGSMERTGFALALYTAQRRSDIAAFKWSQVAGDSLRVTQRKTGTTLQLPIHSELAKALKAVHPRRGETILTGDKGGTLNPIYFGHLMAEAIAAAGLPDDCVLHGLRKTAARIIEELGGKAGSMTGHLSPQMERHYTKRADQKHNAESAIASWEKKGRAS